SFFLVSSFIDSASFAILPAMVLARSANDAAIWGTLLAFFGAGGLLGGAALSLWGVSSGNLAGKGRARRAGARICDSVFANAAGNAGRGCERGATRRLCV
ncbi:MAG: hypothetical protein AAF152_21710, partial [Cyanobacteria bacterium P01_A01_bin.114]